MRAYPIGRLLLKHQYITKADFDRLQAEGEKRDTEEYDLLREMNIIAVSRLMQAFSHIFSLEIVDLDLAEIDEGLLELFPQKSMRKLGVIPLQETEKELCFANPYLLDVVRILQRKGKRIIVLSDMYPVRSGFQRQLCVIVDNQGDAEPVAKGQQFFGFL